MSNEKIIRTQAREALKGNISLLIAAFAVIAASAMFISQFSYLLLVALRVIDLDTEEIKKGAQWLGALIMLGSATLGVLLTPMLNGFMRMAADTVSKGGCELATLFYYFRSPLRYFKSVVINMSLVVLFSLLTLPADGAVNMLFGDSVLAAVLYGVGVLWKLFVFLFFIHYPLAAFAIDDSRGIFRYVFGYIGFSFRHGGALIKLLLTMLGWISLCFFVVPMIYVVPYLETALMNSARWLMAPPRRAPERSYFTQNNQSY